MAGLAGVVVLLLVSDAHGIPHATEGEDTAWCRTVVRAFMKEYTANGCAAVLPYRINLHDFLEDCHHGAEEVRIVFAKLKQIGEEAFTGGGACPRREDNGGEGRRRVDTESRGDSTSLLGIQH